MLIRPVRHRPELTFNLIETIPVGSRHELRVSSVTSDTGHSVAIQAFVDTAEGSGLKPTGRIFVFREYLQDLIDVLTAAKTVVDALPAAGGAP